MSRTHRQPHRGIAAIAAALVVLLAVAPAASAAQQSGSDSVGFGVQPLRHDVETKPGATTTHTITITNTDTNATRYTFAKEDFSGDQDDPGATPVLLGGEFESAISGYDWIQLPDPVSVPPGQSRSVKVTVKVPSDATGAHYTAVMVNGEARSAGQLIATSRVGVLFSMNAGGVPPPEIVITEIQEVGPSTTVTKFINKGSTTIKKPGGTITEDPAIGDPTKIPGKCTENVIPGAAGECVFTDDGTTVGEGGGGLKLGPTERSIDLFGDDPNEEGTSARGELPTEWASAWTSLLLPLVGVALFVLYFLFLRRRRKQESGEDVDLAWSGPAAG